jgi:putative phosphoribosyl transferase
MIFRDREQAGTELANRLLEIGYQDVVVLGIPRGGVIVAAKVAAQLGCPLGIIVARKLGAPGHEELAIGAVTADGSVWLDDDLVAQTGAEEGYLEQEIAKQVDEARRREEVYDHRYRPPLEGRMVVIVDDGLATGSTVKAAVAAARSGGATSVTVAVPIAPSASMAELQRLADTVIALTTPHDFHAVGQFYQDFRPVNDEQVREALAKIDR